MNTFLAFAPPPPFHFSFLINRNSEWPLLSNLLPSGLCYPGAGGAEKPIMKTKEELSMKMHKKNVKKNLREGGRRGRWRDIDGMKIVADILMNAPCQPCQWVDLLSPITGLASSHNWEQNEKNISRARVYMIQIRGSQDMLRNEVSQICNYIPDDPPCHQMRRLNWVGWRNIKSDVEWRGQPYPTPLN